MVPKLPARVAGPLLPLLLTALVSRGVAAQGAPRSPETTQQMVSAALVSIQKAQELFRGRQRMYAKSLGQLGDDVMVRDSVVVTLSGVSATGYVATGRHLGSPTVECALVVGDAPLPAGIPAREIGRPVCVTKKTPE